MIDKQTKIRIDEVTDIVDVVSCFVELHKEGKIYKGLCPFHDDHNPSLVVNPVRGSYKCWVCGQGGDAIAFLMKHEFMSYTKALEWLAKRYGIEINQTEDHGQPSYHQKTREELYKANEIAMQYYEEMLTVPEGAAGLDYFRQRGITEESIRKYHLGYAPFQGKLIDRCMEAGVGIVPLLPTDAYVTFKSGKQVHVRNGLGIMYQHENRFYDLFAGRVIFPWMNLRGQFIGFAGRKLDAATKGVSMKYLNSPESLIYHKGQQLFGLYQAWNSIIRQNAVYIVEGYTDVIALSQCGIENVVSCSGTALSADQAALLKRYAENAVLVFDGDQAGIHAATRGLGILLKAGLNVKIVILPEGEDPDSFCHKRTPEEVQRYLTAEQLDPITHLCNLKLNSVSDIDQRATVINSILATIADTPDIIKQELYLQKLEELSGVDLVVLKQKISELTSQPNE